MHDADGGGVQAARGPAYLPAGTAEGGAGDPVQEEADVGAGVRRRRAGGDGELVQEERFC